MVEEQAEGVGSYLGESKWDLHAAPLRVVLSELGPLGTS